MKQNIFFCACLLLFSHAQAQFTRGNFLAGGSLRFIRQELFPANQANDPDDENKETQLALSLRAAAFTSGRFAIGITTSVHHGSQKQISHGNWPVFSSSVSKTFGHETGIFLRRYAQIRASRFLFYAESALTFGLMRIHNENRSVNQSGNAQGGKSRTDNLLLRARLVPAIAYRINENLLLESGLGAIEFLISGSTFYPDSGTSHNGPVRTTFETNLFPGFLNIGVIYIFGRAEKE